jgi:putative redox protein
MVNSATLTLETVEGTGLRFRARAGNGNEVILESGAGAQGPSPVEALLAAVGGCTGMDVISILRKKRQLVDGYEIAVSGVRREEHPRSFTNIELVHRVRGRNLSAAAVEDAVRLSETKYCSVIASLGKDIRITSRCEIIAA